MDTPSNHPKKKPKSKLGRRKQRKRRSSARSRKVETDEALLVKERENQDQKDLLIVEVGCGDFSTCASNSPTTTNKLHRQPVSSMPETSVNSRSKRLRGATTATIAYTDRKTRSTSSNSNHNFNSTNLSIFVEGQEPEQETALLLASTSSFSNCETRTKEFNNFSNEESGEDVGKEEQDTDTDNNANHYCGTSGTSKRNVVEVVRNKNDGITGLNILENKKSMKSELNEDEEETDEARKIQPFVDTTEQEKIIVHRDLSTTGSKNRGTSTRLENVGEESVTICQSEIKEEKELGGGSVDHTIDTKIVVQNLVQIENNNGSTRELLFRRHKSHENKISKGNTGLVDGGRQHGEKYVKPTNLASPSPSSGGGGGSGFSGGKKCKVGEDRKLTTLAPMLLMNNLPYMGELTFDTRPRRGRKPKKADICHLISKNYGIHFPNSYTNTPYTGDRPPSIPNPSSLSPFSSSVREKVSPLQQTLTLHGKGHTGHRSSKHGGKKSKAGICVVSSSLVSSCPSTSTSQQPPPLLPIGTSSNRFKSSFSSSPKVSGNRNGKNLESQNTTVSQKLDSRSDESDICPGEEPLNLCVRDVSKTFHRQSFNLTNLSSLREDTSETMHLKLPLLSSNLFSDFQLKPATSEKSSSSSKKSRAIEEGLKKFKSNSSSSSGNNFINSRNNLSIGFGSNLPNLGCGSSGENITTLRDLGLVNQLNYQLNLAKCAHLSSESSSLLQLQSREREAFGFAPQHNPIPPGSTRGNKGESRKSIRRKGSSSLSKNEGGESLRGQGQGHHHIPTTTGGSLFGQTDSGSSSGAQVSICKFKFTGGAKPSLQEKKMLSVDSGGNFRFYTDKDKVGGGSSSSTKSSKGQGMSHSTSSASGTGGDGESRPGEKDHQQGVHYAYSALPKSAKSMSVCMPVRPASLRLPTPSSSPCSVVTESGTGVIKLTSASDIQQGTSFSVLSNPQGAVTPTAQELNNLSLDHGRFAFPGCSTSSSQYPGEDEYSSSESSESGGGPSHNHTHNSNSQGASTTSSGHFDAEAFKTRKLLRLKRKRRTRKSLMREKLEKTFKEKGFLIQTQQLESAEGATYCKFRQLRKFTRYLFRSWKDYLPDNVKEINNGNGGPTSGSSGGLLSHNSTLEEAQGLQTEWRVSNNLASSLPGRERDEDDNDEDQDDDDNDDEDDERSTGLGMIELVPEVTLITQPSSPATIVDDEDVDVDTGSELGDASDQDEEDDDDVDVDVDVDVEQVDDRVGDFTSHNHNTP